METADTLVAAIGFRNMLAHEYERVEYNEVYKTLHTGLSVYKNYINRFEWWGVDLTLCILTAVNLKYRRRGKLAQSV
ncbi:HepT-like ribonuclease domain-containing protein [Halorubrum sp. RMP-47]|uniref:HepT-like ribonuclease domain-containing protein n=1 Tax=Halorubrum miltondacostae TaxID=3076378 RepID=UPI003527BA06